MMKPASYRMMDWEGKQKLESGMSSLQMKSH